MILDAQNIDCEIIAMSSENVNMITDKHKTDRENITKVSENIRMLVDPSHKGPRCAEAVENS